MGGLVEVKMELDGEPRPHNMDAGVATRKLVRISGVALSLMQP